MHAFLSCQHPSYTSPFSLGLGNKDNWSFQLNFDLSLPKCLILKLATNYLPPYLFHSSQGSINFSPPPHKKPPIFFSNIYDFRTSLKASLIFGFVSYVLRKEPSNSQIPQRPAVLHLFTHHVLNMQERNKKKGQKMGGGHWNNICYI